MSLSAKSNHADPDRQSVVWPLVISAAAHLLLFVLIIYSPISKSESTYTPGIIDVQIVDLKMPENVGSKPSSADRPVEPIADKAPPEKITELSPKHEPVAKPEVSVAPEKPQKKVALKYKTMKSKEVLKKALERLEKEVEDEPEQQLADTIKRLQKQVAKEGRPADSVEPAVTNKEEEALQSGVPGMGGEKEAELIDIYRTEVAYAIQKNWAYSEQLAGAADNLEVRVIFKVMPDGQISDIIFTDRSGNAYLDDSALKAIKKSSPVKPHPKGLVRPYVEMGLRFTPSGVQ